MVRAAGTLPSKAFARFGVHRGCARTIARAIMKLSGLGVVACNQRGSGTGTSPSSSANPGPPPTPSVAPTASAPPPAPAPTVDLAVDVAALLKEYKSNELRGDQVYKGKRIRIMGKAGDIKRDITNTIYVTVGTGAQFQVPTAQCFFGDEFAERVADIQPGTPIVADCTIDGLMMNVLAKKCSFPNVAPYNACLTLQNAGIVAQCPFAYWTSDNMPFLMAALPPNASTDVLNKTTGFIIPFKDDAALAKMSARLDAIALDAGKVKESVAAPSAHVLAILPDGASPSLRARIKAVFDKLPAY
jgi:tRNA_anti-like